MGYTRKRNLHLVLVSFLHLVADGMYESHLSFGGKVVLTYCGLARDFFEMWGEIENSL